MNEVIKQLADALHEVESDIENPSPAQVQVLFGAAQQALGALRAVGDNAIMYDMARLAAHAGHYPEDFDQKANR